MTKLLEIIRYHSFWVIDFFKGSKVKSHYNEIKFVLENYHDDKSAQKRDRFLNSLLSHAKDNVPFYKSFRNSKSLLDFPVVNKLILRESMEQFISDNYKQKDSFEVSTSGSTGTPFIVLQDKNKKYRNTADTLYFGEKAGYRIGQKLFYIRAWGNLLTKSRLASFLQNIVTINVKGLDTSSIPQIINQIEVGGSSKAFIGYPSAFKEICKYLDSVKAKPFNARVTSIIANAEPLSDITKKAIKKYFGIDALSRYSNMENGILSQQIKNGGKNFHINWASYYIEILDLEKDMPVKYGEIGRVVVTDLFNFHMPLIRYDTGDLAVMDIDKNSFNGAPSFFKVEGRRMDTIYDTKGRILTTVVYELECFPEFKQFQFIQEGEKEYRVKINIDDTFKREEEMINLLKSYLGDDAEIHVEYVVEIPQLSSGKRKLTLNNYKA